MQSVQILVVETIQGNQKHSQNNNVQPIENNQFCFITSAFVENSKRNIRNVVNQ